MKNTLVRLQTHYSHGNCSLLINFAIYEKHSYLLCLIDVIVAIYSDYSCSNQCMLPERSRKSSTLL